MATAVDPLVACDGCQKFNPDADVVSGWTDRILKINAFVQCRCGFFDRKGSEVAAKARATKVDFVTKPQYSRGI